MVTNKITGIILAGGKSKRMGTEKGLIRLRNIPLIEHVLKTLTPVCDHILISSNSDLYNYLNYPVIPDKIQNAGPMGGIYSCLQKTKTDFNLVISCDTPFINTNLLKHIISNIRNFEIVVPSVTNNNIESLCAFYNKNTIPLFEKFIRAKNYKMQDLIRQTNFKLLHITKEFDFFVPELFYNINTPADLDKLSRT